MKKQLIIFVLFFGISFCSFAQNKPTKTVEVKAAEVSKSRGTNPNIIKDFSCNGPDVEEAKPAKSRGYYCTINFDNYTGYYVKVYVDGYYRGMVSPYSDDNVTVYSGYTSIYCVTTGGSLEWSASGGCDGYYSFELRR